MFGCVKNNLKQELNYCLGHRHMPLWQGTYYITQGHSLGGYHLL